REQGVWRSASSGPGSRAHPLGSKHGIALLELREHVTCGRSDLSRCVGTNLTDLLLRRKVTIRELGGCMGPIWPSYYGDCGAVLFMIDAASPTQVAASCTQLLSVLSAEPLALPAGTVAAPVSLPSGDLPCYMSLVELKSLLRMQDIVSCATQPIAMVETSARDGTGLADVLQWLQAAL
uniref:ADP ribosylation factor like GTPase 16 n=1 Tax=Nothoprocta perdicaria TaxID=30464 RepID=A0A8C6ZDU0_NOTPE